jgi:NADH:ubiquinone oxidoreductase subunit 3 (subunit A)
LYFVYDVCYTLLRHFCGAGGLPYLLAQYGYIGILLIVAILFTVIMPLIPLILSLIGIVPRKKTPAKLSTYECGMESVGDAWIQFNFRYYLFAVLFVALDVISVFLYPWAINLGELGLFGLLGIVVFFLIIMVGYTYAWVKGALQWK